MKVNQTMLCGDLYHPVHNKDIYHFVLPGDGQRLVYMRRLVLLTPESVQGDREKYCRLMAYNDTRMMLAMTQPSFNASGFNSTIPPHVQESTQSFPQY